MRRFEFSEGVSNKFWEVEQDGCALHIRYGKLGTAGQAQTKTHPDPASATAAMEKLIREKTGKGYLESAAAPLAPTAEPPTEPAPMPVSVPALTPTPTSAAPVPISPAAAVPAGVAPWLAVGPLVAMPTELAEQAMPSRRVPGATRRIDADACWENFKPLAQFCQRFDSTLCDPAYRDAVAETIERVANDRRRGSKESDVILLCLEKEKRYVHGAEPDTSFTDFLVADRGLIYAVEVFLQKLGTTLVSDCIDEVRMFGMSAAAGERSEHESDEYNESDLTLREHLAQAPQDEWERCVQLMRQAAPSIPTWRQPLLAVLLPDAPELANELALSLQTPEGEPPGQWHRQYVWLDVYATSDAATKALRRWPHTLRRNYSDLCDTPRLVATMIQDRDVDAVKILRASGYTDAWDGMACIGTLASMTEMTLSYSESTYYFDRYLAAAQRWPQAAIAVLSESIAKDGCGPARARQVLATVVAAHAGGVPAFKPWISAAAWKVLSTAAAQYITVRDIAAHADLPSALASPRWAAPSRTAPSRLTLAPLALAPVVRWSDDQRRQLSTQQRYTTFSYGTSAEARDHLTAALAAGGDDGIRDAWIACLEAGQYLYEAPRMIADLPSPLNAQVWNAVAGIEMNHPGYAIATLGLDGLPGLIAMIERRPAQNLAYALHFGAIELAPLVARAYATLKGKAPLANARKWLLDYAEYAACGLAAAALDRSHGAREHARLALRMLAAAGHAELLIDVAGRYQQDGVTQAMRALIDEDPLDLYPAKIGKLPAFWTPAAWTRPLLAANRKALPDAVLDTIGTMLSFPHKDGIYPGITQLRQACTPDSLADFAWDLFRAWVEDGAPAKENWAFVALGLLGNDDSARKLTPLLRSWPGEQQHARAVVGLDILALIGSDTALMLLNGIAQKIRFKALRDRAGEKIADVAEARGLTAEELDDRLAPDLDLDDQGEMLLDFGARQFRVGFDEALKPYVRDEAGARLPDLPKPKKTDDAELSTDAVARFKLLKKDARTIAAQQVLRLETAMCAQRRWQTQAFREVLAGHPLLRHLVRRLVWGVYEVADGGSYGGRLLACFRVAPEGGYTNADDDAFELPQGAHIRVGVPHALDLAPSDAAAFGQLFADYELLQPFAQIGRDIHALGADETDSHGLWRWNETPVPTGRVLGLVNHGWHRAPAEDFGQIREFSKRLGDGHVAVLHISPGLAAGNVSAYPEQTLDHVMVGRVDEWGGMAGKVTMSSLDPVLVSELIRDMEQLCA